jgi:hypothetical protein
MPKGWLVDKSVATNRCCKNCKHYEKERCVLIDTSKNAWNKCKQFDWTSHKKYKCDPPLPPEEPKTKAPQNTMTSLRVPLKIRKPPETVASYTLTARAVLIDFLALPKNGILPKGIEDEMRRCRTISELNMMRRRIINEIYEEGILKIRERYSE